MTEYSVGLVGEQFYQDAITRTNPGEVANIYWEPDNPHDPDALVVENDVGETLGYIPKDNWLHRAVHDEGKRPTATIRSVLRHTDSITHVVINVTLSSGDIGIRDFRRD